MAIHQLQSISSNQHFEVNLRALKAGVKDDSISLNSADCTVKLPELESWIHGIFTGCVGLGELTVLCFCFLTDKMWMTVATL